MSLELFARCVGVGKKSLFERPNIGAGQSFLRVLGAWSGRIGNLLYGRAHDSVKIEGD